MQKWMINVVPCPASTATPPYSEYSKTSLVWGHCIQVYSCAGILYQHVKPNLIQSSMGTIIPVLTTFIFFNLYNINNNVEFNYCKYLI